ncbi:delta-lactam-biosynthetic de-N-acetylase [Bacillus sp. HMF5848]|uniref:delta-lactam-biosynthetic de-N-acetylase n=1 Tax=Bacillus sp. HMF5848 TaxID=2495421 RepID=UPI000F7796CF|nr:delta-lactam-biosynthetic de-N-acetylase [Bacillus sp. HMF5848]RSK29243.1 delta-lactam-biosynthetic de-N-acetylase [Bacillus sp. HMF5848]
MMLLLLFCSTAFAETYSNEPLNWGFKKSRNHQPPDPGAIYKNVLNDYGSFYIGDTREKIVYITFDNGYEYGFTDEILDVLKQKKVPATFFVTGPYLEKEEDLIQRMVDEGHIIGNHSWSHPDFTKVTDEKLKKELDSVKQKKEELTGQPGMMYLRPPRGVFSERTLAVSQQLGYVNVFWSLAYVDWETGKQKGWEYAYDKIMGQIHPGAVILLHAVSEDNAKALPKIIDDLRKEGYEFKSLDYALAKQLIPEPFIFTLD